MISRALDKAGEFKTNKLFYKDNLLRLGKTTRTHSYQIGSRGNCFVLAGFCIPLNNFFSDAGVC